MELQGNGFTLRQWQHGDEGSLQKYADNPRVSAYLFDRFPSPYTADDAKFWVNLQQSAAQLTTFAIVIDAEAVGGIGIELRDDVYSRNAKFGYWLGEPFWGRGIMPEAARLVVDYGFQHFDLVRLEAGVFSNNPRSMRVLEKAGFVLEAVNHKAIYKRGELLDEHVYAKFR